MKKAAAIVFISAIILLGLWCWMYKSYIEVQDKIVHACESRNWAKAVELLNTYESQGISFPIYHIPLFERFRLRLRYHEGVVWGKLGDRVVSGQAFNEASQSVEADIVSSSLYNLALYEVERGNLETARTYLSRALLLNPTDTEAKVNLEIVLKRISAQNVEPAEQTEGEKELPAEQWRDIPTYEGEGGSETRRSYL